MKFILRTIFAAILSWTVREFLESQTRARKPLETEHLD